MCAENPEEVNLPREESDVKIIVRGGYDFDPRRQSLDSCRHCFMSNWDAPVIREGWGRFKTYYAVEWSYDGYHCIDTSRSFAEMLAKVCEESNERGKWPGCDFVNNLVYDLRLQPSKPPILSKAEELFFSTIFPIGLSEFMEDSYIHRLLPEHVHLTEPRVLNNPRFYLNRSAPLGRLVEIAEEGGRIWVIDRANPIPSDDTLANEIASLCHALTEPEKVSAIHAKLRESIAEQMDIYRLMPNL